MAQKKISLTAWINSKLKDKDISASQAKKNAGKYKSISAAKKAGSLYYTNKEGKVMIAAYAEDLTMPMKRPESLEKKPEVKIIKKTLPTPDWYKKFKIKEADKKSMEILKFNRNITAYNTLSPKVKPRPGLIIHVDALKNRRDRKAWDEKYGNTHNRDGTLKEITIPKLQKYTSSKRNRNK